MVNISLNMEYIQVNQAMIHAVYYIRCFCDFIGINTRKFHKLAPYLDGEAESPVLSSGMKPESLLGLFSRGILSNLEWQALTRETR